MEVVTMPNGHTPEEAIWDELTIYGASTPSYSRWEFSESIVPPAFLGAVQVEVDTTTLPRQDYFPRTNYCSTRNLIPDTIGVIHILPSKTNLYHLNA
jgi:hypothetical protein